VVGGFGNFLVPLMIGARRTAFPRIQALAFWLIPFAALILLSSIIVGGFPSGWTGYATPFDLQRVARVICSIHEKAQ
jgi:cytochrome c oxidase subunit 1